MYRVAVDGADVDGHFYRLWAPATAPPLAETSLRVPWSHAGGVSVIRGQRPTVFPITDLRQATAIAGITAGAIATPVIYHNLQMDHQAPRSP
jgi:hypothetical protein